MPLVFDHVTYHYDTEVVGPALDDVSLTVNDGEFVAFIGHTGSGKSTLAEHCNATKLPSSGTVTMDGLCTADRKARREVFDIVKSLHARGTTIVMVSHSMEDVAEAAQRIVVLDHGRIIAEGAPEVVFSHATLLHNVGLDVPLPARVAYELGKRGFDVGCEPLTLDALADAVAAGLGKGRGRGVDAKAGASVRDAASEGGDRQ